MSEALYNRCVELYRAGHLPLKIVELTEFSRKEVMNAIQRARKRGDITKIQAVEGPTVRRYLQMSEIALGSIGGILNELSDEQAQWLVEETENIGCSTVAEYLAEVVRDLHADAVLAHQQGDERPPYDGG